MTYQFCIVTPSYNQASFLPYALASVARQAGVGPVQHVVADGGSSDESRAILERHGSQLAVWRSQRDGGQTAALNWGFSHCAARYCGWLNSDDHYLPGAFAAVAARFEAPDRPDVVFGYSLTIDGRGALLRENRFDDFSMAMLAGVAFDFNQPSLFWRSEMNRHVFPLDESLRFCMDVELVARLALSGARFSRLPRFLSAFRVHEASKTSNIVHVGRAEYLRIAHRLRTRQPGLGRMPPIALRAHRRLRMIVRGEHRYALLGGRLGLSHEARRAAAEASQWLESTCPRYC
jgi:glycosyltransferase involved in cell wall biosynthesis